jgi:hypothetical protein
MRLNALFGATPAAAPYIQSLVHIKGKELKFEDQADGSKKLVFDVLAYAFGDNGSVVEQLGKTYTLVLQKAAYERVIKTGFVYDFTFPVKKPGAYQLRVAVRDHGTDNVGSANQFIEVPNLKKDRLVLSGVVLENMTLSDYQLRAAGKPTAIMPDPMTDTSLRQFKRGTVLNYGYAIFNSKPGSAEGGSLSSLMRLYRDGKLIFEGKPQAIPGAGKAGTVNASGTIALGAAMLPGDYVMQIVVTDNLAREKYRSAAQFAQFEIVD